MALRVNKEGGFRETSAGDRGPSAYEVAVANGFSGTVEEWLTLQVDDGGIVGPTSTEPGPQGDPGPGSTIHVGPTPPLNPQPNDLWVNTT